MLRLTWTVPCNWVSGINNNKRVTHQYRSAGISTISSINGSNNNQLRLLLPLKNSNNMNNNKVVCNSVQPGGGGAGGPFNSWQGWLLGVVVSLIVPFWRNKWLPFLSIKNKVDTVVDTVEAVAEAVEHVAEKVEEIADEIGNNLPEGGKLRAAFDLVENIAKETAKDAHIIDDFIEKVEAVEDKVEDLIEPMVTLANYEAQKKETTIVVVDELNSQDTTTNTTTTINS